MEPTESGPSVKQNIGQVEDYIRSLQSNLRDYKKLVENLRAETLAMENKVSLGIEDIPKSIAPQIEEVLIDLRQQISRQKDQNEHLQKQITSLKKEKSILHQHLIASNTRGQILEEHVGCAKSKHV